jgi:hypothetical protein
MDMAGRHTDFPNVHNIRINGVRKAVTENSNMYGSFTTETFTPFVELDFIWTDAWEHVLGKTRAEVGTPGCVCYEGEGGGGSKCV